jgi:hypothetical protein
MRFTRSLAAAAVMVVAAAAPSFAQSDSTQRTTATPPAVSTSNAEAKTTAAPVAGKNSFTSGEAQKRLESFGYTNVSGLHQDDQSIWRGTATKSGQSVQIGLDYQGNIVTQ